MKLSLNWLKRYIDLPEGVQEIADSLTLLGFEVDDIETTGIPQLDNVVVGEVLDREQHPDADRLGVCRVALGDEHGETTIVCGASNYKVGDRVPVAMIGAELPGGFKIKKSKLRGVESNGMMCSGKEIGAGEDAAGLLILKNSPELGTPINKVLTDSDTVFTLEVTPNRPDCLNHVGIARELAAWYKRELRYPSIDTLPISDEVVENDVLKSVEIECEEECPRYLATIIKGVKVGPSPAWMQELLASIGLRPINNIVDVTNYVMHEYGNPMHAFDARDIADGKIVVRKATDSEEIATLDDEKRTLSEEMVVIADSHKALAIAGVMGGANSEVKDDTVNVILEVAYFNPAKIRWMSKQLALSTDSSYRFERGVDPRSLEFAAKRAAELIVETAGGSICQKKIEAGAAPVWQNEITLDTDWIRAKAGFEISDEEIKNALQSLELSVSVQNDGAWLVAIPSYRGDLGRPIDLLEEVLRIYGTHRIPSGQVFATAVAKNDHPITEYIRATRGYLVGQDFSETVTYTLRPESEFAAWTDEKVMSDLSLKNPISEDQTLLRSNLVPGLLEVLKLNQSRKTGATRFFETGRTFGESRGKPVEMVSVAFVVCSEGTEKSWRDVIAEDYFSAKRRVEELAKMAGMDLGKFRVNPASGDNKAWQAGHAAVVDEPKAGFAAQIGLLNLSYTKELDIDGEVFAGSFSILSERIREPKRVKFKPFSLFPATAKDLAIVVDKGEAASEVVRAVGKIASKATKGFDVENVFVFDVYEGSGVPEGKKSVAVSMVFRSADRTLKDKEVNKAFEQIQSQIREKTNYDLRD
ncbi:phenylalanine--tRNA ligase subunit beta [Puniceicoccaceae bacterium K14]|nr:phenylalanine--tRNA ligase subunit beta [Puniceicoccaceae bacterium K14]